MMKLKTRAALVTAGILVLVLAVNTLVNLLASVVCILIAVALVYFFMDRRFVRPLSEMSETTSLMAAGDLSQEVPVKGKTEIDALAGAINAMSLNLREMLGKVRATGAGLKDAMNLVGGSTLKMSQGARVQQEATEQTAMTINEMIASTDRFLSFN